MITIVGLGPGNPAHLTLEAREALAAAPEVYLRTRIHPVVPHLPPGPRYESFDALYETLPTFAQVYEAMTWEVLRLGLRPTGVVYAVPGHPLVGETSVVQIRQQAEKAGVPVRIVPGLSFVDAVCVTLGLDPLEKGLQWVDATTLESPADFPPLVTWTPVAPLLLVQLYNQRVAAQAKLALLESYPPEHLVTLVRAAGVPGEERVVTLPLFELDRQTWLDHLTSAYLPPLGELDRPAGFAALSRLVTRLRAPGGCPWDREQTRASLRPFVIEEAYEVADAIDRDDPDDLCEELGDLLLQVLLHAQIANEEGLFTLGQVLDGLAAKLVRRHPHVFGNVTADDAQTVLANWQAIKAGEKQVKAISEQLSASNASALDGVPRSLPGLTLADAIQKKAAKVGFDWPDVRGVVAKVHEEVEELMQAPAGEQPGELGDLIFSLVNLARWLGIDPEEALRATVRRFEARFRAMEALCQQEDRNFADLSLEEKDVLWERVK